MKRPVTLIAPVAPFRGGIARHSEAVGKALAVRPDVALEGESFARLYPQWLYPGQSDRDTGEVRQPAFPTRYAIDTLNPLSWRGAASRIAARGGIALIPAWTFFVAPALGTLARRLRKRGVCVAMIVHNVGDHDGSGWKSHLSDWQLAAADIFVTHSDQLAESLRQRGHGQPVAVVPHPAYGDFPAATGALPRERALELLCFGLVRPYKGVDIALRALARSGLEDVRLTVAGEIWEDRAGLLRLAQELGLAGRVEFRDRYIPDDETAELFARCDAVLAPYRAVTGSGVLALAQHYRRPVIASDLPGLADIIEHGRTGWLFNAADEAALAQLLGSTVDRKTAFAMKAALDQSTAAQGWENYAEAILNLADARPLPNPRGL